MPPQQNQNVPPTPPPAAPVPPPIPPTPTAPTTAPDSAAAPRSMLGSMGPTLGLVILAMAVILGGLYVWGSRISPDELAEPMAQTEQTNPQNGEERQNLNSSDEIAAIQADLDSSSSLDAEMAEMEAEMNAMEAEMNAQ